MMELKVGKAVDLISTSTHEDVSAHVLDYINIHLMRNNLVGIRQFLVEQYGIDDFTLTISKAAAFDPASLDTFINKMREYFGSQINVSVHYVDDIPLEATGKRRYFRNKQAS